jgi:hypothetical protein
MIQKKLISKTKTVEISAKINSKLFGLLNIYKSIQNGGKNYLIKYTGIFDLCKT